MGTSVRDGRIAVIGAGAAGLAAARELMAHGLEPVIFERAGTEGGLWVLHEHSLGGGGPAYRSLRTNTSKQVTAFSDTPFACDLPDFPHREAVLAYLKRFASRHDIVNHVRFHQEVVDAAPQTNGAWLLTVRTSQGEQSERFGGLLVCSGIHNDPFVPAVPGLTSFPGRVMHSSAYVEPKQLANGNVVVVGMGSSAGDVAAELATVEPVTLSTRQGAWVRPRYLAGRPFDHLDTRAFHALPPGLRAELTGYRLLKEYQVRGWGDPRPRERRLFAPDAQTLLRRGRVTTNDDLLPRILEGQIRVRPSMTRIEGERVVFADGTEARADALVFCTGYRRNFPFLRDRVALHADSSIDLYRHVFHPDLHNLAFLGMVRVQGAVLPILELQARWVADVFVGRAQLPSPGVMRAEIEARRLRQAGSNAPFMRVQFLAYGDELASQIDAKPHLWDHPGQMNRLLRYPPLASQWRRRL